MRHEIGDMVPVDAPGEGLRGKGHEPGSFRADGRHQRVRDDDLGTKEGLFQLLLEPAQPVFGPQDPGGAVRGAQDPHAPVRCHLDGAGQGHGGDPLADDHDLAALGIAVGLAVGIQSSAQSLGPVPAIGHAHHIRGTEPLFQNLRGLQSRGGDHQIDMGTARLLQLLQIASHGPPGQDPPSPAPEPFRDGLIRAVDGEIQGGQPQDVHRPVGCFGHTLGEMPCESRQGHGRALDIGGHARGGEAEGGDPRPLLDDHGCGLVVEAGHGGDGGARQGNEPGLQFPGGIHDIADELFVIAQKK